MDAEHYRLRDFLTRTAQPYEWHEAGSTEADRLLESLGLRDATLPVLVDGDLNFTEATVETIAAAWGGLRPAKRAHYDFVVIGAGPAGLAAAVYEACPPARRGRRRASRGRRRRRRRQRRDRRARRR